LCCLCTSVVLFVSWVPVRLGVSVGVLSLRLHGSVPLPFSLLAPFLFMNFETLMSYIGPYAFAPATIRRCVCVNLCVCHTGGLLCSALQYWSYPVGFPSLDSVVLRLPSTVQVRGGIPSSWYRFRCDLSGWRNLVIVRTVTMGSGYLCGCCLYCDRLCGLSQGVGHGSSGCPSRQS
jgi:hypothetical protein